MDEGDKLLKIYQEVHGDISRNYSITPAYDEEEDNMVLLLTTVSDCGTRDITVSVYTKADLLFDYITKEW